ncbi:TonB-dependent siderophore receptor [Bradyrhizobium sp. Ai1a-2]|uniref:TonB-dependent siderophore receptor n=1 Tax=Bradyrhizobium sp. Ai1a-2 TaxID=196490 RepID=UPI001267AC88|nr:TonB-dependent siderophore receptor [Bradyrhizobium sp. Ai1a-2]
MTVAKAQTAAPSRGEGASLPPVTVDAPKQRTQSRAATTRATRSARSARPTTAPGRGTETARTETSASKGTFQQGNGPIQGYVAHRSLVGTKTNTSLLETPQSISVIGREQMRDQNAQSVVQALSYTPGVTTNSPNDTRFESLRIRGFQPVLYLDGMQLPYGASQFGQPKIDVNLLERIEVLRGPSSSLYGQVAPGGMINLVSRLPTATPLNSIEFLANSWGRAQANFDIGGVVPKSAFSTGDFYYRLVGTVHGGGTQVDFVDDYRGAIAPSFTWKPDLDTTFTFLSGYQRDVTGLALQFFPSAGTLLPNPNGRVPLTKFLGEPAFDRFDRTQYWAGYQFEHSFNETWTVRQNLRYFGLETDTYAVAGGGALGITALQPNLRTLNRGVFSFPENANAFTVDNQAEARFATGPFAHTLLFGVDYRRINSELDMRVGNAPPINLYNTVYGAPIAFPATRTNYSGQRQDQTGVYMQDQIALGGWRLTLSGRHDWVSTDTLNFLRNTRQSQDDSALTGRVGLNYIFDSGVAPYIAYGTSFQPTLGVTQAQTPFQPTTAEQVEIGVKYAPPGTNMLVTAALFDITQENITTPDPSNPLFNVQTGAARSRGGELEVTATLTEGLNLVGSYSYTDTEVTKTNIANQLGKQLIIQPINQAALWVDYTVQQGQLAGFGLGGGVRYIGDSYGDAANTIPIPGYTLLDATIHYDLSYLDPKLRGVKLAVNAQNLFDKYYVSWCNSLNSCFLGSGRVVTGSVRYTW